MKILAIDDGIPPKTATATLTVIVHDINDNPPRFLKDYRPVLQEHSQQKKVVEISATDDDDRSKSNGPPFTFRMDPKADDVIRASFKVESDNSEWRGCANRWGRGWKNGCWPLSRADIVALDNERVFLSFQRERTGTVWPLFPRYCRSTGSSKRST